MSEVDDKIDEAMAGGLDAYVILKRCFFYDLDGYALRLWDGSGRLFTADGSEWLGTVDANGSDHHRVPEIGDERDGTSVRAEFGIPYLDAATYHKLKADQWRVFGRRLTVYYAFIDADEGLRPSTPLDFLARYTLQGVTFDEGQQLASDGSVVKTYAVKVIAKGGNAGRSWARGGTYTPTGQRDRARTFGVMNDKGCDFVPLLANRTYQRP